MRNSGIGPDVEDLKKIAGDKGQTLQLQRYRSQRKVRSCG